MVWAESCGTVDRERWNTNKYLQYTLSTISDFSKYPSEVFIDHLYLLTHRIHLLLLLTNGLLQLLDHIPLYLYNSSHSLDLNLVPKPSMLKSSPIIYHCQNHKIIIRVVLAMTTSHSPTCSTSMSDWSPEPFLIINNLKAPPGRLTSILSTGFFHDL